MPSARRNWTPDEDALLRRAVQLAQSQSRPLLWRELAKSVPGRSNKGCRRRWWNSLAGGTTKGPWSTEEDERLIAAVQKYGTRWRQVSREVGSRNADQCSSHWCQVLDPNINYCDWTPQEDTDLLHAILTHGTNWTTIAASHTPARTTLAVRNRYSTLRLKNANVNRHRANGEEVDKAVSKDTGSSNDINGIFQAQGWDGAEGTSESDDEDDGDDGDEDDEDCYKEDVEEEDIQDVDMEDTTQEKDNAAQAKDTANSSAAYRRDTMTIQVPDSSFITWDKQSQINNRTNSSTGHTTPPTMSVDNHTLYDAQLKFGSSSSLPYPAPSGRYYYEQDPDSMGLGLPYTAYDTSPLESHADLPMLSGFQTSSQSTPTLSADAPVPMSMGLGTPLSTRSSTGSPHSTVYKVSVNMVCTRGQLDAVLGQLADVGSGVTIKLDTKS
ncbi:hypothetical protein OIDMADRAFT_177482 [Oidiodendron maius Zn]|uniref:Uncharacterized protein n=1 Tax=Oidiodendron maius (strain Zn) TaxID=913774 RepID=A0A0C3DT01_OIDMZ|nr:hypothetical protein OIDMADRAFT_177482 [Oidiodendron maius Zn]